jgi:hypothetical protein
MKVNSTLIGNLVLLVNTDEILPQGGVHLPDVIPLVADRYKFEFSPTFAESIEKVREKGFRFEAGKIQRGDGSTGSIEEFTLYNDGIVIKASTTEDAEAFLEDVLFWGKETLQFRVDYAMQQTRFLLSQVVVQFDDSIDRMIHRFEAISNLLSDTLSKTYQLRLPVQFASVMFDFDRLSAPSQYSNVGAFKIERRIGHSFEENIFLSTAAIRTPDHIHLLEQFEILLKN